MPWQWQIRRARRLFPALAVMLGVTLAAGWHKLLAVAYEALLKQTSATLVLGANFHFYSATDYFRNELEEPLLHCWSLAVEEQAI